MKRIQVKKKGQKEFQIAKKSLKKARDVDKKVQ
jgi:hypothetical protein